MGELVSATESISPIWAVIYPFIPVVILLGFYYAAGADQDDDDDSFGGGKGIRVGQMEPVPVTVPTGA
jgi:hypothetical protein|tara:strand:- start:181 stop:384 length:204 start_codon:yes stop_codon:yes gene_type:complete